MQPTLTFDVECYRNFFLVLFQNIETGEFTRVQLSPNRRLDKALLLNTLSNSLLIGFNSTEYDLPMIQLALRGHTAEELKEYSDEIIKGSGSARDFGERHGLSRPPWNHIDLINVAPLKASLKLYAGRLHCKKLQDLPIDPDAILTAEDAALITQYCGNDLRNTAALYHELEGQIALRVEMSREYQIDLRSRSDAQVAEHVIASEVAKINGTRPKRPTGLEGKVYKYQVPAYISFQSARLQELLETIRNADFVVGDNGAITLPAVLADVDVRIGGGRYRIGIGGLHSSETSVAHVASDKVLLVDRDVASFYPRIILNQGLYPIHMGTAFTTVYQGLVDRRLEAKKDGDKLTAESLKIAVNGSFGKLGSKWSALYAPDLLIQVTLTGQLVLLMLIEMIESRAMRVLSANTDGVLTRVPALLYPLFLEVVAEWEKITNFETEETQYRAVYSKDVNNYLAIKTDGKVKGKGLYSCPWDGLTEGPAVFKLHKNPSTTIVIEAMIGLLRDGIPLETTIRECRDIRKFTAVRTVTGGARQADVYIGKVVRWIYSRDAGGNVMSYRKSGYKVPKSEHSRPLMELPDEFPADVNYDWYIAEARAALGNIGYAQRSLFEEAA